TRRLLTIVWETEGKIMSDIKVTTSQLSNKISEAESRPQREDSSSFTISWFGLEQAGKTTILRRLQNGTFNPPIFQTIGFNTYSIKIEGQNFFCWDTSGQWMSNQQYLPCFLKDIQGIVFVVDSAAPERFVDIKEFWDTILSAPEIQPDTPILILANKQDLSIAVPIEKIREELQLNVYTRKVLIFPVSAKTGLNLDKALKSFGKILQR
ncbi:MAG: ADP-ribosylation factor-like protein, partial [Candidatus Hodarchaeota archaeon]